MKRRSTFALIALFLLALVLSGCSDAGGPAEAALDGEDTAEAPADTQENPAGWAVALDFEISHATNMCGFLNEDFGITVGYAGEAHYTNDGAKKWPPASNNSMCLFALDIVDSKTAWAAGNGNDVRMTSNGGSTWGRRQDAEIGTRHSFIDFVDDKNGWVANLSKLAATSDGANTWEEITLPEKADSIAAICLRTPECGYLMTRGGLLFTTVDGGASWTEQDLDFSQYNISDNKGNIGVLNKKDIALADISFADENNGTIVFSGMIPGEGIITVCLITADGGKTWKPVPMPDVGFPVKKVFLTSDGQYLTLGSDSNQTAVLKRQCN